MIKISSIYLTTKEDLFVTPPFKSQYEDVPPIQNQTILINSDKIILNAQKHGNIVLSSVKNVIVSSKEEVIIETPKLTIGGDEIEKNMVLGKKLLEIKWYSNNIRSGLVCPVKLLKFVFNKSDRTKPDLNYGVEIHPGILSKEHKIQDNTKHQHGRSDYQTNVEMIWVGIHLKVIDKARNVETKWCNKGLSDGYHNTGNDFTFKYNFNNW